MSWAPLSPGAEPIRRARGLSRLASRPLAPGRGALRGLDATRIEVMLVRTAWHEWGHALSLARAIPEDVAAGSRYLDDAPPGVADIIRLGGYRRGEFTHEVVAETYALLMARRRRAETGEPRWLQLVPPVVDPMRP